MTISTRSVTKLRGMIRRNKASAEDTIINGGLLVIALYRVDIRDETVCWSGERGVYGGISCAG